MPSVRRMWRVHSSGPENLVFDMACTWGRISGCTRSVGHLHADLDQLDRSKHVGNGNPRHRAAPEDLHVSPPRARQRHTCRNERSSACPDAANNRVIRPKEVNSVAFSRAAPATGDIRPCRGHPRGGGAVTNSVEAANAFGVEDLLHAVDWPTVLQPST